MRKRVHELDVRIGDWYVKAYPSDRDIVEEGYDLYGMTFRELHDRLKAGREFNYNDSIVRERVFEELCVLVNVDYDEICDMWLATA